jgi:hypothetical protein
MVKSAYSSNEHTSLINTPRHKVYKEQRVMETYFVFPKGKVMLIPPTLITVNHARRHIL